jgi:hypothetical protein
MAGTRNRWRWGFEGAALDPAAAAPGSGVPARAPPRRPSSPPAERSPTTTRSGYHRPWYDAQRPDPFAAALRAAKAAVDPRGILNPGVLIEPALATVSP